MAKRLFDIICAAGALIVTAPVIALAMLGIALTNPGPVLYRATRVGRGARPFTMYKLRTMRVDGGSSRSRITACDDPRVFPFGRFLRATKIDELPQLVNILRGEMSVIGPRPENPDLVAAHYGPEHHATLAIRPGLSSPGSLYHDTHGTRFLADRDTEAAYVEHLLPIKLALDLVYVERASVWYDIRLICRTLVVITGKLVGRQRYPDPPELKAAQGIPTPSRAVTAALLTMALMTSAACELPGGTDTDDDAIATLVGAGDISRCEDPDRDDEATAKLLDTIPGTVITLGDNTYPRGTAQEFAECYHPTWGRHLDRTRPAVGNHEYETAGAAPYFNYFGPAAGDPDKGYYNYEAGAWHVIVLNSEIDMGEGSEQHGWLRGVLDEPSNRCTLAYWHRPRFNYGSISDSPDLGDVWLTLYEAGVDVVLNGHEHNYQRYPPQTPAGEPDSEYGIQQFIVGTGGGDIEPVTNPYVDGSILTGQGAAGVIVLTLRPDAYEWTFAPIEGKTFTDTGQHSCHDAPPVTTVTHNQLLRAPNGTVPRRGL